jgi:hypothetical protein
MKDGAHNSERVGGRKEGYGKLLLGNVKKSMKNIFSFPIILTASARLVI